jgi:hypothetical protein
VNVPAGGDLTGVLPNPQIAPQAVGPAELAALPGAKARATLAQVIPDTDATKVAFDVEEFDSGGLFTKAQDDEGIHVTLTGTYHVVGHVYWQNNPNGVRTLSVTRNNASVASASVAPVQGVATLQQVSGIVRLSAGDVVSLQAFHFGAGVNLALANDTTGRASLAVQFVSR